MCISICILIVLGAVLYIVAQALNTRITYDGADIAKHKGRKADMIKAIMWCTQLSYLMGAVALLLILCCLCCRDVEFGSHHEKDDYE